LISFLEVRRRTCLIAGCHDLSNLQLELPDRAYTSFSDMRGDIDGENL
jgi:hypothetical protein